jgi:glycosyltransferase involved in cell wall biosynthesis
LSRLRVALVVPYCGPATYGGASALALAVARRLDAAFDVELLTTCATDYETWHNAEPAGPAQLEGVRVLRFAVDRERDRATFDRLSRRIIDAPDPPLEEQERWMHAQGPSSRALLDHLEAWGKRYDAVVFFSYLYATTYFGLPLVEDRAVLVPLAHDEWPLKFSLWDRFFARPRAFVFGTEEERGLLRNRFPALEIAGPIAGIGIEAPAGADGARFRARTGIAEAFLLYLGRIDPSKGCDELLTDFANFRAGSDAFTRLVLIGERHMDLPPAKDVIVLGPLDEAGKWDALAACDVFVMPSPYESLSIAMLEAWTQARPVLVNGRAQPLVGQCRRAGGGLWYVSADEFTACLDALDADVRRRLGESGRRYASRWATWARVEAVYRDVLERIAEA